MTSYFQEAHTPQVDAANRQGPRVYCQTAFTKANRSIVYMRRVIYHTMLLKIDVCFVALKFEKIPVPQACRTFSFFLSLLRKLKLCAFYSREEEQK